MLAPKYLRDCLELLRKHEDSNSLEAALGAVEQLVRLRLPDLRDVCVELTAALLHLGTNSLVMDNDTSNHQRFLAQVALSAECCDLVVPKLLDEFFGDNYTVSQRIDMLDVLAAAAEELSSLRSSDSAVGCPLPVRRHMNEDHPLEIVRQRVERKTKRRGQDTRSALRTGVNRFAPVAGLFFYQLIGGLFEARLAALSLAHVAHARVPPRRRGQ